jgi:hypothetical protein
MAKPATAALLIVFLSLTGALGQAPGEKQAPAARGLLDNELVRRLETMVEGRATKPNDKELLASQFAALRVANERRDAGSVFFIGSTIVGIAWNNLVVAIQQTKGLDEEPTKKGFRKEVTELDRFLSALEKIAVGPFQFDRQREEVMVASVRDKMAFTKLHIRALLKADKWEEAKETLELAKAAQSLYLEVLDLRRISSRLNGEVQKLNDDLQQLREEVRRLREEKDAPDCVPCPDSNCKPIRHRCILGAFRRRRL